ncbi:unannotated protein [freshwater metagenome]|uniref:Unannotated protein n=1 Tax=freshwater metagenome TaxID=449393 RepID=A0A6J7IRI8_9ZZZZ
MQGPEDAGHADRVGQHPGLQRPVRRHPRGQRTAQEGEHGEGGEDRAGRQRRRRAQLHLGDRGAERLVEAAHRPGRQDQPGHRQQRPPRTGGHQHPGPQRRRGTPGPARPRRHGLRPQRQQDGDHGQQHPDHDERELPGRRAVVDQRPGQQRPQRDAQHRRRPGHHRRQPRPPRRRGVHHVGTQRTGGQPGGQPLERAPGGELAHPVDVQQEHQAHGRGHQRGQADRPPAQVVGQAAQHQQGHRGHRQVDRGHHRQVGVGEPVLRAVGVVERDRRPGRDEHQHERRRRDGEPGRTGQAHRHRAGPLAGWAARKGPGPGDHPPRTGPSPSVPVAQGRISTFRAWRWSISR